MSMVTRIDAEDIRDVYLQSFLKVFAQWLDDPQVTEIMVNRPGEVWVERSGTVEMECVHSEAISDQLLKRLATQIARVSHQAINREQPLLGATLPGGERVQLVGPPASGSHWALAIRRHVIQDLKIEDFAHPDGFDAVATGNDNPQSAEDAELAELLWNHRVAEFLRLAVLRKKTMLIAGGTSTGKTSLLNALMAEASDHERIITVEDTAEVHLRQPNRVSLVAVKGSMGEARIDMNDLLQSALRMRPDRIIVGEVRGKEASTFLRAINTGHPGSITTVHADSPAGALNQLALMVMQAGLPLSRDETINYIRSIVDIIIQLRRVDGRRAIDQVVLTRTMLD